MTNLDLISDSVALTLFPQTYHTGLDCQNQRGREGLPCTACADQYSEWLFQVARVKAALAPHIPEQPL